MKKLNLGIGLVACLLMVGCMPDSLTKFHEDPVKPEAASGSSTTTSSTVPSVNLATLTAFQVKNISPVATTTYAMHKYGQSFAATDCEIPVANLADGETLLTNADGVTDTGANDIVCWLDAEELQLYHNGFDLQVNVPAGYCDYIRVEPYYFWKFAPANTAKVLKEVSCDDTAAAYCPAGGEVTLSATDKLCVGDYSTLTPAGPNCDEGTVTINSYSYVTGASVAAAIAAGDASAVETITECGGRRTDCYAGPGYDFNKDSGGNPMPIDYWAWTGDTVTYSVSRLDGLGKNLSSNRYAANYTNIFANGTYTYDYTTVPSISGLERYSEYESSKTQNYTTLGITKLDDISGVTNTSIAVTDYARDPLKMSGGYEVNPFYTFTCINSADEVKGRIRLQVREWNQKFTTTTVAGDQINRSNHSRFKKHSANSTDYETSGIKYWNDVMDWDTPIPYGSTAAVVPTGAAIFNYGYSFPGFGL